MEQIARLTTGISAQEHLDNIIVFFEAWLKRRLYQYPGLIMKFPRVRHARRGLQTLYDEILEAHKPEKREGKAPDLIDNILELHRTDPQFFPEIDLPISVLGPFIAGLDTAASICGFALYELLKRPDLVARVNAEADALFSSKTLTLSVLRQLDVTHRIVREALRLYSVAAVQVRTVTNAFEFEGYQVPVGETVIIGTNVLHHIPQYFPNPERFDIERYTLERAEHRQNDAYAPFGMGVHRCLGAGFAEVQIAFTLATIMREAELALASPEYKLKIRQFPLPHPDKSIKFRLMRRRQ